MKKAAIDPRDASLRPEGVPEGRVCGLGPGPEIDDLQAERSRREKGEVRSDLSAIGRTAIGLA